MSKIVLNWYGNPLELQLVREDNFEQEYRYRDDLVTVSLKGKHTVLKQKAPSGADLVRHDLMLTYSRFATPTAFPAQVNVNFSVTLADNTTITDAVGIVTALTSLSETNAAITSMLNRAPLPTA